MAAEGFWNNPERARADMAHLKHAKAIVEPLDALEKQAGDLEAMLELMAAGDDPELEKELGSTLAAARVALDKVEFRVMLGGEHDHRSAFLSIQAGAGGTEACDWAEMLMRMYLRWCERNGYKVEEVDRTNAEGGRDPLGHAPRHR